jgi:hypothetical protein
MDKDEMTFVCANGERVIVESKVVAHLPYVNAMMSSGMSESHSHIITLDQFRGDDLRSLFDFMKELKALTPVYKERSIGQILDILPVASYLQEERVLKKCVEGLKRLSNEYLDKEFSFVFAHINMIPEDLAAPFVERVTDYLFDVMYPRLLLFPEIGKCCSRASPVPLKMTRDFFDHFAEIAGDFDRLNALVGTCLRCKRDLRICPICLGPGTYCIKSTCLKTFQSSMSKVNERDRIYCLYYFFRFLLFSLWGRI